MNRVTKRTVKNLSNVVLSEESFGYDAAGNITSAPTGSFAYDTDNRLTTFNGNTVSYDMDGNLLSNGAMTCTYDSANRLLTSGGHTYTYNAEGVRIRNLCAGEDAAYTYNTNSKLSQLLMKTVGTAVTKYVYGLGLIGEETDGDFKTYHFDSRGSTIAITDEDGNITDTFAYDTYGKMTSRTGTTPVIFGYNGKHGVVTDANGLLYMRARYYSPAMRRFVNADIIPGNISKAVTLNRYAFADANPVMFVDPLGLSVWSWFKKNIVDPVVDGVTTAGNAIADGATTVVKWVNNNIAQPIIEFFSNDSHKVEGTVSDDSVYASGSVSGGNNDFNFSDKGEYDVVPEKEYNGFTGVEAGVSVANAEGEVGYSNGVVDASIGGGVDVLQASAAAGIMHGGDEKGFKLGAGASVVSGQAGVTFEVLGVGFEIGVSASVLTAEARLNAGMIETNGKKEFSFGGKVGAFLFGLGIDIGITIPG